MSVCKRLKQAVCKTAPFRFAGSNPARHTIRPLRQVGPSRQPLKLESAVRVCQGSYKHLCQKGVSCRGRLTVGQQLAKLPSRKSRHVSSNLTLCAICLLVRVVDEIGPENRRWETVRRFESFSKRHAKSPKSAIIRGFWRLFLFDATICDIIATENNK